MEFPFSVTELSVFAIFLATAALIVYRLPEIIREVDAFFTNRSRQRREEDAEEFARMEQANQSSRNTITAQNDLISRQQALLNQAQSWADTIIERDTRKEAQIDALKDELDGLREQYQKLLPLQGQVTALQAQINKRDDDIKELRNQIADLKAENVKYAAENERLEKEVQKLATQRDELAARLEKLEQGNTDIGAADDKKDAA